MSTVIRPQISEKNKYWINKHRHYELKHFCLQYPTWKKLYLDALESTLSAAAIERTSNTNIPSDITSKYATKTAYYSEKIAMIEKAAMEADSDLYSYILKAVTEGLSYTYLRTQMNIPCGKDLYYDRYRRFFWILSNSRD